MQLSSNQPAMHSQTHADTARTAFTFRQNDELAIKYDRDERTHEFPIGRFAPDLASLSNDLESALLEHYDEGDDFMPLFACDSKAFGKKNL